MLYWILRPTARLLFRVGFKLRVTGTENVPPQGPAILAANHTSVLDPPLVGACVPRPIQFMAKAELFRIPLLGALIRDLNAHPVERDGADAGALRHALLLLREGKALLMFPEGTRGTEGTLGPGRPGAGLLAAHSEAPVVPVYIRGTGVVLPRGATRLRWAPITVVFGPALRFTRGRGRQHYQDISDRIMAAIARLKAASDGGPAAAAVVHETTGLLGTRVTGADNLPTGRRWDNAERTARGLRPAGQIH